MRRTLMAGIFPEPGEYELAVPCLEDTCDTASLKAIRFTPVQ